MDIQTPLPLKKVGGFLALMGLCIGLWLYENAPDKKAYLPDDPQAQMALQLVKNHTSRKAGTVEEALAEMVARLREEGVTLHEGDWRVASQGENIYLVSKIIREKGSVEWIERDFAWRVNAKERWVQVISLAAQSLMPFENLPPLPHGAEISQTPKVPSTANRPG